MGSNPAILLAAPGESLPEGFEDSWQVAGFVPAVRGDVGSVQWQREPPQALTVLWVGRAWKACDEQLRNIPASHLQRTILIGYAPPQTAADDVRKAGGLAAFGWPLPAGALDALAAALVRGQDGSEADFSRTLASLETDSGQPPQVILERVLEAARLLVGSTAADLVLGVPGRKGTFVLSRVDGGYSLRRSGAAARSLGIRSSLLEGLPADSSITALPASTFRSDHAAGMSLALTVSLKRSLGGDLAFRPAGAILLVWATPVLLASWDLARLGTLASVAAGALSRLSEAALAAIRQRTLNNALAELSRASDRSARGVHQEILRDILEAFASCPGLMAVWARASSSSRAEGSWTSYPAAPPIPRPDIGPRLAGEGSSGRSDDVFIMRLSFPGTPSAAQVIAAFDSRASAANGQMLMAQLSDALFLAVRLIRRARDSRAVDELSRASEGDNSVPATGRMVQSRVDADGAKIFVLQRDPEGETTRQLFHSDLRDVTAQVIPSQAVRFGSENKGFADWVLRNDDWLLVPTRAEPDKIGEQEEFCLTGKHGEVRVRARKEEEYAPGLPRQTRDHERTMIFYPLASRGKVAGVLAVWRLSAHPFSPDLDIESLAYLAPYVADTCQGALRNQKASEHEDATALLAREFSGAKTLSEVYIAVARGIARLAEAACAVLFHYDRFHGGRLSQSAIWVAGGGSCDEDTDPFVVESGPHPASWSEAVKAQSGLRFPRFSFRTLLILPGSLPSLAVALFDPPDSVSEQLFFSDDLLEHFARSYLQFAADLLKTNVRALGSRLVDEIGDEPAAERTSPRHILAKVATVLKRATSADAVLIYTGTPRRMKTRFSLADKVVDLDFRVETGALTDESLKSGQPRRVLDLAHGQCDIDHSHLGSLAKALGWMGVRSWLICPILYEGQTKGLIKLLTKPGGTFFCEDHEELVAVISRRVASEMYKASRRAVLEDMLQLSNEIASETGRDLGKRMAEGLRRWAVKSLLRENCAVVIVSRLEAGESLIMEATPAMSASDLTALGELSLNWGKKPYTWSEGLLVHRGGSKRTSRAGHAEPIGLLGTRLVGHLVLLDDEVFQSDEVEMIEQVAGSMAIILNGERERVTEKQKMGRFRHAVLGPVQGMTSAAHLLAALAEEAGVERAKLEPLRTRVYAEAEVLRLWRENQRFYQNEKVEIKVRPQPLKPVVDRCIERYRDLLRERQIELRLEWPYRGGLQVTIDDHAVDLVLSNLLDNARKYSFFRTSLTVGVQVRERDDEIAVWVEDVGHGVPEAHQAEIYEPGKRFVGADPYRTISGEGLGLAMSAAIVEAHGGSLFHTSEKVVEGRSPETTRYRVRFTFTLPLSWRAMDEHEHRPRAHPSVGR